MEADQKNCNPGLVLTIGTGHSSTAPRPDHRLRKEQIDLQLWFSPESQKAVCQEQDWDRSGCKLTDQEEDANNRSSLCHQDHDNVARKKLRLNKEQTVLLEKRFKEHSTLTPTQKRELAAKLNLRPRQVEVWFQNRRARTKLKQTEVDCEFLKRCCETLSNENRRLKKELQELRSVGKLPPSPSFYLQHQRRAADCTAVCPSCERACPSSLKSVNGLDGAKPKLLIGTLPDTSMACSEAAG